LAALLLGQPTAASRRSATAAAKARKSERASRTATWTDDHARAVLACDFFVTVTATFRVLSIFVVLAVGTRLFHEAAASYAESASIGSSDVSGTSDDAAKSLSRSKPRP